MAPSIEKISAVTFRVSNMKMSVQVLSGCARHGASLRRRNCQYSGGYRTSSTRAPADFSGGLGHGFCGLMYENLA
jgi:hypothetical protein